MELVRIRSGRTVDTAEVATEPDSDVLKKWARRLGEDPSDVELRVQAPGRREQRIRV